MMTLSMKTLRIECQYAERRYTECGKLFIVMLCVIKASVSILYAIMLNVVVPI
jgi:hypothetical protein